MVARIKRTNTNQNRGIMDRDNITNINLHPLNTRRHIHLLQALRNVLLRKVLCHEVRRVLLAFHLNYFHCLPQDFTLQPKVPHFNVPHSPQTSSGRKGFRCTRICPQHDLFSETAHPNFGSHRLQVRRLQDSSNHAVVFCLRAAEC